MRVISVSYTHLYIRELALELSKGADSPLEKARRFYDYITLHMTYTYMPSYFSLENIAENCARSFTGDCGVFALLFLTLCRFVKIPACWQSGLITEPDFCGAHDWVRFYICLLYTSKKSSAKTAQKRKQNNPGTVGKIFECRSDNDYKIRKWNEKPECIND